MPNKKGDYGEQLAKTFLMDRGYTLIETNYKSKNGEIDIIAMNDGYIVFIEVKYRKSLRYGLPREAVNKAKQLTIKKVAMNYIAYKNITDSDFRFDVIEIIDQEKIEINHIENAFY